MNTTNNYIDTSPYKVRLFVAGDSPNSLIAKENLKAIQEQLKGRQFEVEVIDVMENPQTALENSIYLTPALQVISPGPGSIIFGNLSDRNALQTLFPGSLK